MFDKPEHNYYTNVSSPKATTSVSSTSSSVKRQRIKAQEVNLANLQKVLEEKISQVKEEFTFVEYLEVLKSLNLVCSTFLTPSEESLVTRSWHTISFYQNGNIVTNAENIKVFIAGVLGVNEEWMFSQVKYIHASFNGSFSRTKIAILHRITKLQTLRQKEATHLG